MLETTWDRRTTAKVLLLSALIMFTIVVSVDPSSTNGLLFVTVKNYANNDPRCQTDLTYAQPNNDNSRWSIVEYHYRGDYSVNWEKVNLFLHELDYYDEQAYWCDYVSIYADHWQYSLFLWFQIGETEFVFLSP